MTQAERDALALARRRLSQAERRRVTVAADYAEAVRSYNRKRSPASRALAYREVERQYVRALEATERRELAGRSYDDVARRVFQAEQRRRAKRKTKAASVDPAGTEYELTATTEGGSPSKGRGYRDPRVLHLKIRVILDRPMSQEQARGLLDAALRRRQSVTGITITGMDWAKGEQAGTAAGTGADLRRFYGAISRSATRFSRVRQ